MYRQFVFALGIMALIPCSASYGQPKPKITVQLEVAADMYKKKFKGTPLKYIESEARRDIMQALSSTYGFLDFTDAGAADTLLIRVVERERSASSSSLVDIVYRMNLRGQHVKGGRDAMDWIFVRKQDADLQIPDSVHFQGKISAVFAAILGTPEKDRFVRDILRNVRLADTALVLRKYLRWVMPFTNTDLNIDRTSQFEVVCDFTPEMFEFTRAYLVEIDGVYTMADSLANVRFRRGMLGTTVQGNVDDLKSDAPMKVRELYLVRYVPNLSGFVAPVRQDTLGNGR